jgi:hypothetical protein
MTWMPPPEIHHSLPRARHRGAATHCLTGRPGSFNAFNKAPEQMKGTRVISQQAVQGCFDTAYPVLHLAQSKQQVIPDQCIDPRPALPLVSTDSQIRFRTMKSGECRICARSWRQRLVLDFANDLENIGFRE